MKVVSINSLPRFDIKLNSQYNMVLPSVVKTEATLNIPIAEVDYPSEWRSFEQSDKTLHLTIGNLQNNTFDRLIDFDNEGLCSKIEYLTIGGFVGFVSDNIGRLINLKYLHLNEVSSISPLIGTLAKLEELVLENCHQLELIPFEIYEIRSLKKLTINRLGYYENFSPRINKLINLEYLTLKDHFPFIADEITQLPKLKCVDIERSQPCIYDIPNLEALHIRVLHSSSLKGINKLSSLKELWLDAREISDEIASIKALKYLIIYNFQEAAIPDLSQLSNVEVLVFHGCSNLTCIPDFVYRLPALKYLGLRFLNNVRTIPVEINSIPHLQYLEIASEEETAFGELPEFRSGLFVYRQISWNSHERIN